MQKPQPKYQQRKESLPEKLNPASNKPSAQRRVAFFAGAVSENADKGGFTVWHTFIFTDEQKQRANSVDLVDFLQRQG